MDGTFTVVGEPFSASGQLMSIHAFVKKDGMRKQFSLAFAIMSRKRKEDYVQILQALKDTLQHYVVEVVVLDFEKGAWQAIRVVFPDVEVKGCVFHWSQAIWRKVQDLGLVTTYKKRQAMYTYIQQLMALPFLPAVHIVETFDELKGRAQHN
ncbi:uncharacterized protein LOC121380989 [Gigantopelta aegis]|uniref:uncharacterized protein LOC121380989 n=1 Tax=Gigantopelta aegis TaxID=1735272 RepID=UPI001B88CA96|nr:uncharacterized protein LOC121380989 [Gigantopelta aegis]